MLNVVIFLDITSVARMQTDVSDQHITTFGVENHCQGIFYALEYCLADF
jgi:hypothetical protein